MYFRSRARFPCGSLLAAHTRGPPLLSVSTSLYAMSSSVVPTLNNLCKHRNHLSLSSLYTSLLTYWLHSILSRKSFLFLNRFPFTSAIPSFPNILYTHESLLVYGMRTFAQPRTHTLFPIPNMRENKPLFFRTYFCAKYAYFYLSRPVPFYPVLFCSNHTFICNKFMSNRSDYRFVFVFSGLLCGQVSRIRSVVALPFRADLECYRTPSAPLVFLADCRFVFCVSPS